MNKFIKLFLILSSLLIIFVSCSSGTTSPTTSPADNPTTDNPTTDNPTQPINKLINLNLLSNYKANIINAKALGISKLEKNTSRAAEVVSKNYIVKTTEEYTDSNYEYNTNQLTKVTFTKVRTEIEATESESIEEITASENGLLFQSVENMYYDIYEAESLIYESILDNDENDKEPLAGEILITENIINGNTYVIKGYKYEESPIITQEQLDGEIDKLYVLNNYVFISFVPIGLSKRPEEENLNYGSDGIALYDKCDYFSDNTRQSFVINTETGYIYSINNFHIKEIRGGCLLSNTDSYLYDFKINKADELEIFSLFTNDSINMLDCFKDCYGNIFIENDKINYFDPINKSYFYCITGANAQKNFYQLSSLGNAVKIQISDMTGDGFPTTDVFAYISDIEIITENNTTRKLTENDSFSIIPSSSKSIKVLKVKNGIVYGMAGDLNGFGILSSVFYYNSINKIHKHFYTDWTGNHHYNFDYIPSYEVLLEFKDSKLYVINNIYNLLQECVGENQCIGYFDPLAQNYNDKKLLLEDCSFEDNKILSYGINGNTYYDIVVETDASGNIVVNQYVSGTYTKPQIKIQLQPINR